MITAAMQRERARLAARYLAGRGIEIGALDCPLPLPANATARYLDRLGVAELRAHYPELAQRQLQEPDVIDDGEHLESVASASLDFIVANHMLEHCEDPLGTLQVHLDRVRPGGVLFYAIPDKRKCFDKPRPLTDFRHLLADHADGGAGSRWDHFMEWATYVNAIADPAAAAENARTNMRNEYSIHFHAWTPDTFRQFLEDAGEYFQHAFSVAHLATNRTEIISVLRRN